MNPAFAISTESAESLTAHVAQRTEISACERQELFALLSTYFSGVTEAQFARDLDEKDWVLRIRRGERLLGFTTLQVFHTVSDGQPLNVMYSGDTITDPDVWRSPVLARSWIAMVRHIQGSRADERWVWLLLSSGFRTYRFLPLFWREFWPRFDRPTPPDTERLLQHLARERFGTLFDEHTGIVRFPRPQQLRGELGEIPEGKQHDPHVRFFLARNRGHQAGDELVCLTDLSDANLTAAGARMTRGLLPHQPDPASA